MNKTTTPLQKAMENAGKKVKSRKIPEKKQSKGKDLCTPDNCYYPPNLYLSDKDFPGIENFAVGQKVQLAISVEVTSMNLREENGQKRVNCDLKLTEISDITPKKGA